jgi:hypothetical protein
MTITVDWYNNNHTGIVHTHFGDWTWAEFFTALDQTVQLMDTVHHRVNVISDVRQSRHMPIMLPSILEKIATAPITTHRQCGLFIIVGAKPFLNAIYGIFSRLYPRAATQYRFVEGQEQLEVLLAAHQPILSIS